MILPPIIIIIIIATLAHTHLHPLLHGKKVLLVVKAMWPRLAHKPQTSNICRPHYLTRTPHRTYMENRLGYLQNEPVEVSSRLRESNSSF